MTYAIAPHTILFGGGVIRRISLIEAIRAVTQTSLNMYSVLPIDMESYAQAGLIGAAILAQSIGT
jgi:predicted NBD/HSP70 family sugar kinase